MCVAQVSIEILTILTLCFHEFPQCRGIAVDVATGYELDDRKAGLESRGGQEFSLLHVIQTGAEVHPASYSMGTTEHFRRG
jgi:hypothetical protein